MCPGTLGKPLIKTLALPGRAERSKCGSAFSSCLFPLGSRAICRCEKPLGWISETRRSHSIDAARLWQSAICSPSRLPSSSQWVTKQTHSTHWGKSITTHKLHIPGQVQALCNLLTSPPTHFFFCGNSWITPRKHNLITTSRLSLPPSRSHHDVHLLALNLQAKICLPSQTARAI